MTIRELSAWIGTYCFMEPVPGLRFYAKVLNAKTAYGRPRVEIEALAGEGSAWVGVQSVSPCRPRPRADDCAHAAGAPRPEDERGEL